MPRPTKLTGGYNQNFQGKGVMYNLPRPVNKLQAAHKNYVDYTAENAATTAVQDYVDSLLLTNYGGTILVVSGSFDAVNDASVTLPLLGVIDPLTTWQLTGKAYLIVATYTQGGESQEVEITLGSDAQAGDVSVVLSSNLATQVGAWTFVQASLPENGTTNVPVLVNDSNSLVATITQNSDADVMTCYILFELQLVGLPIT